MGVETDGQKVAYARAVATAAAELVEWRKKNGYLHREFWDRGFNTGGENEIIDAVLAELGIPATLLGSMTDVLNSINTAIDNNLATMIKIIRR